MNKWFKITMGLCAFCFAGIIFSAVMCLWGDDEFWSNMATSFAGGMIFFLMVAHVVNEVCDE